MVSQYETLVNDIKDKVLTAVATRTSPSHVGADWLRAAAPECIQADDSITAFSDSKRTTQLLQSSATAVLLHLVAQSSDSQLQIMQLKLGSGDQPAVAIVIDALIWLCQQVPDNPELSYLPATCVEIVTDIITSIECEGVFAYVDSRLAEFKQLKSKQTLLRTCNDLLRRLSKSHNTMLCGRILLFLAKFLPLTEKSGQNIVGAFNSTHETPVEDIGEGTLDSEGKALDVAFYKTFWSLQSYFSDPKLALKPGNWAEVYRSVTAVLEKLSTEKISITETPPEGAGDAENGISVKYLTGSRLIGLQIKDATLRRQFLIQCLVLLHWCENPQHKDCAPLTGKALEDAQSLQNKVFKELQATPECGKEFAAAVGHLISVEDAWVTWKHANCPSDKLQIPPAQPPSDAAKSNITAVHLQKKRKVSQDAIFGVRVGTEELDRLWNITEDNTSTLTAADRGGFKTLRQLMEPVIDEMNDPETDEGSKVSKNQLYSWKTLRLVARENLKAFADSVRRGGDLEVAARTLYPEEVPPEPVAPPAPPAAEPTTAADTAAAPVEEGGEAKVVEDTEMGAADTEEQELDLEEDQGKETAEEEGEEEEEQGGAPEAANGDASGDEEQDVLQEGEEATATEEEADVPPAETAVEDDAGGQAEDQVVHIDGEGQPEDAGDALMQDDGDDNPSGRAHHDDGSGSGSEEETGSSDEEGEIAVDETDVLVSDDFD